MNTESRSQSLLREMHTRIRAGWTAHMASLVLIVVTYLSLLMQVNTIELSVITSIILGVMCVLYVIITLYGETLCEMRDSIILKVIYFTIQITLSVGIFILSQGVGFTSLLPIILIGHAEGLLPKKGVIVVGAVIVLSMAIFMGTEQGLATAISVSLSIGAGLVFVAMFSRIAMNEQRARERSEHLTLELEQANTKLRAYAVQAEELAMTKERNRIAREIHDGMGHFLTAINVQIRAAQALMPTAPDKAIEALNNAMALSSQALSEVRNSVATLRAGPLDEHSLHKSIEGLVTELQAAGVHVDFTVHGHGRQLPPRVALTVYRAVQEGLTNTRKHARAENASIELIYLDGSVRLNISDDGIGAKAITGGFGLTGLQERVNLLNGTLSLDTAPDQGMHITVELETV